MDAELERLAAGYRGFAANETRERSPLYAELAEGVASDRELLAWLAAMPRGKRQPNLLFASVRHLTGLPAGWPEFRAALAAERDAVQALMLARRTQTNEAGRCATLLPLLAALPQPLALLEVGASAGLCLLPDRYAYDFDGHRLEPAARGPVAPPVLRCALSGVAPPPRLPEVAWRAGLDLEPIDLDDAEALRWLEDLVWPGEGERLQTLRAAVALARTDPPRVVRGDLRSDLGALAAEAPADATLVVFHTAVLTYVPREDRVGFPRAVRSLGAVWISNERPRVLSGLDAGPPPFGGAFLLARDGVPVGWTDPHGARLVAAG